MKKATTSNSKNTTYNPYIFGNATQKWVDKEHNIKILFAPSPEYPSVWNLAQLRFNVQDLKTGSHARNTTATVEFSLFVARIVILRSLYDEIVLSFKWLYNSVKRRLQII